ncbi:MAG: OmpH family outer membrane protein [Bacteroidota bacterium]
MMKTLGRYPALFMGLLLIPGLVGSAAAQQKIGYVDSAFILSQMPEYATVQQQIDRLAQDYQAELEERQQEVEELFREYQARELLYTNEERQRKQAEIISAEDGIERLRDRYFGPDGELFREQEQRLRPIQERVLEAVEKVATDDGYDYVLDKSSQVLFLFAREQFDLSPLVLEELGIDVDETSTQGNP